MNRVAIRSLLRQVQADITGRDPGENCHRAYRDAEYGYWSHLPEWINRLPSGIRVLDVGAACGTLAIFTKRCLGADVTVVDAISLDRLAVLFEAEGIPYIIRDIERAGIEDLGKFDLIIFTEVLEHLNFKPEATLRKLSSALKLGGVLLLSTPDASSSWGRVIKYDNSLGDLPDVELNAPRIDDHIWLFTPDEVRGALSECDLAVAEIRTSTASPGYKHLNVRAIRRPSSQDRARFKDWLGFRG